MNKRILLIVIAMLVWSMALTPFVLARPGVEKENEKFLPLQITKIGGPPVGPVVTINHPEPPKEPEFRRVIIPEGLLYAEILIDGDAYYLGVDFTYECTIAIDYHLNSDPVFGNLIADQTYDFTLSGIDGKLEVLTVGKVWGLPPSESWGSSRGYGTGDLEGVKLMATGWHEPTGEVIHMGTITGWPDV